MSPGPDAGVAEPGMVEERMLVFFEFRHLPSHLTVVSAPYRALAHELVTCIPPGPERTVALRKLLESKDCAVRAILEELDREGASVQGKLLDLRGALQRADVEVAERPPLTSGAEGA